MLKKVSIVVSMIILCGVVLLACAKRTYIVQNYSPEAADQLKDTLVIFRDFSVKPSIAKGQHALKECKGGAMEFLKPKAHFKDVLEKADIKYNGPILFVDAQITDLRIVSGATRFFAGTLAGRSHMKILVSIFDKHKTKIAGKELFGAPNSFGSMYSFGNNDRSLPYKMGNLLGEYILSEACRTNVN
ncbi:MAG: hypothetical protein GY874_08320 [Desulfobacteraceae bacterium]|nr:hypothetical protein [Desulfobacteraceae bacterium]